MQIGGHFQQVLRQVALGLEALEVTAGAEVPARPGEQEGAAGTGGRVEGHPEQLPRQIEVDGVASMRSVQLDVRDAVEPAHADRVAHRASS